VICQFLVFSISEKDLAKSAKKNPKAIWKYIKSKSKRRSGIGELLTDQKDPNSRKTDDDKEKAEILAEFFQSVFTKEPNLLGTSLSLKDCSNIIFNGIAIVSTIYFNILGCILSGPGDLSIVIKDMKNNKFFTDRQYGLISGRSTSYNY
jgi:hypothetical protein